MIRYNTTTTSILSIARVFSTTSRQYSRLGRQPIAYPNEVQISVDSFTPTRSFPECRSRVIVSGPKGELSHPLHPFVNVDVVDAKGGPKNEVQVSVSDPESRKQKMMWGTTRALLNNMIEGVTEGYMVPLRIVGVGYRALMENGKLSLKLGYTHPILLDIPEGVTVQIPQPQRVFLFGIDKLVVTQFAAQIRRWRPPEPYNQKGIFVGDETIKKKEGKKR